MKMRVAAAAVASAALLLSACAANESGGEAPGGDSGSGLTGTLTGVGASSMASAQEVWVANFQTTNPDVTVNYSPDGSGAGREAFAGGGADFAGSDRAMTAEEVAPEALAGSRCAEGSTAMNLPVYISPIAIIFNVEGVDELQLDAETLAKIFKGDITNWNDPAIADQNPDAELPDLQITAVHRADDSGTTENFTDYLHVAAPEVWDAEADGEWPYEGGEAAPQTSGMVDTVTNGTGTIGYADASRAGELGVAKIKVGDDYVEYSPEAAAAIVEESPKVEEAGLSPNDQSIELDRLAEGDVYPIVLVSYAIACDSYADPNTAALVKSYLGYIASDEGQQAAVEAAGIAPLSAAVSEAVAGSIAAIQ
ncbi:phosphate ABC transporter substrate-binding protein PstS [Naumannella halotolerans]|uniref:phosphate ABC transporter substrate-binding protein PstS n=1 Tax=Naumannella halotolerans TaxID=993414 RepID=UPI00370D8170